LIIGSFLNVVALRFNTGKSLGGRSGCFSCGHQLSWYELIPVVSWIIQRGRCRSCSSHVSPMYVLGELTTGIFFAGIAVRGFIAGANFEQLFNVNYLIATIFLWLVFSILLIILFYDIRHKIIPNELSLAFGVLAFISLFFFGFDNGMYTMIGPMIPSFEHIIAGLVIPLPFVLIWLISKGQWMGLGDPKLMVGMGLFFGLSQGISAVFLSFWIGALCALFIVVINYVLKKSLLRSGKTSIMKQEIPFAPFMIIATLITVVAHANFFAFI
jgi:prepilin signal peptidase PulO-like enzyme (type II secretory pathway)